MIKFGEAEARKFSGMMDGFSRLLTTKMES